MKRTIAIVASDAAALRAGASSAQDRSLEPSAAPDVLAADCARPLPAPVGGVPATFLKLDGIQGESKAAGHLDELVSGATVGWPGSARHR